MISSLTQRLDLLSVKKLDTIWGDLVSLIRPVYLHLRFGSLSVSSF
jgi:hypothetical protein